MIGKALLRKGWCPGVRRPMPAKDGLLVRLRITGGIVTAPVLRMLAHAGRDHGNGFFDLSARGNLQIRGVREANLPALVEMLGELGLAGENAASEAVRNILLNPLAGLNGCNETVEAAKALEGLLANNEDLHALPGKFGFLIDDGGPLSLGTIAADIRFDWVGGTRPFAIGIGGCASEAVFLGQCSAASIPSIAAQLARAFLKLGLSMAETPRRMRNLIAHCGAKAIAGEAGLCICETPKPRSAGEPCPVGPMRFYDIACFGAGVTFGSLDADMLEAAAQAAEIYGAGEIRLTPWRSLIIPHIREDQAGAISAFFAKSGFIAEREDPRLAVAACAGAATCDRGTTDTRSDALSLMILARQLYKTGIALHVSGCVKDCARQAAVPLTLIAHDGVYDLFADKAARNAGISNARRLGIPAVQNLLAAAVHKAGHGMS